MTNKKKMENNWKNCFLWSEDIHAFCFQWTHQRDLPRVAGVIESVFPGAKCSFEIPKETFEIPKRPKNSDDTDLRITGIIHDYGEAAIVCSPGDWIFIKNAKHGGLDCNVIPAEDWEGWEWEVCK